MFATAGQSAAWVFGFYDRACRHGDQTIAALGLEAETARHVGQADILREAIDGSAGLMPGNSNPPPGGGDYWAAHRARLQDLADQFKK